MKKRIKTFFKKAVLTLSVMLPMMSLGATQAFAKDSDHSGMVYLETKLEPGLNHVSSTTNGVAVGDNWGGQDVKKSPEFVAEQMFWGKDSWSNTNTILGKNFAPIPSGLGNPWSAFDDSKAGDTFSNVAKKQGFTDTDRNKPKQTNNLVLSFPGWGAGDTIPDLRTGSSKSARGWDNKGDRNSNKTPDNFAHINQSEQSKAASAVNEKLVSDFNSALDLFYSHVEGNPTLSKAGTANMVWAVANGYLPTGKDSVIKYDSNTGQFSNGGSLSRGTLVKSPELRSNKEDSSNIRSQTKAGKGLITIKTADKGSSKNNLNKSFTYAVVKGSTGGAAPNGKYAGSDEYALTWLDLAYGALAHGYIGDTESKASSGSNNTVVADQANQLLYNTVSGLLSQLGIKTVDDLVFGQAGNLFQNGTYEVYLALMAPFFVVALIILTLVVVEAYRKSNMNYLSTGQVQSIQSSLGRIVNAVVMIMLMPWGVLTAIAIDGQLVNIVKGLSDSVNQMVKLISDTGGVMGSISGIIIALLLAFINIKFTFRYVARAISFGIFFIVSPVVFALDSLKGDGGIFQYGPMTGTIWKNLLGLVFQRSMDALGLLFAFSIGRLIFGAGPIIAIIGALAVEAVTNALMDLFGVSSSSIKGIAETGDRVFRKSLKTGLAGAGAFGGALVGTRGARAMAAARSGENLDKTDYLNSKQFTQNDELNRLANGGKVDFNKETPTTPRKRSIFRNGQGAANAGANGANPSTVAAGANAGNVPGANGAGFGGVGILPRMFGASAVNDKMAYAADGTGPGDGSGTHGNNEKGFTLNSGMTDANGAHIRKNAVADASGRRAKTSGLFAQGVSNNGVYGDRNTVGGAVINGNRKPANIDYARTKDGRLVGNGFVDKSKIAGRALARGAGGALFGGGVGSMGRSLMGAGFAGIAAMTPGNLDNWVGAGIIGNELENTMTGGRKGLASSLGSSMVTRALGVNGGAFNIDKVGSTGPSGGHQMMSGQQNGLAGSADNGQAARAARLSTEPGVASKVFTAYNPADKANADVLSSTDNFLNYLSESNQMPKETDPSQQGTEDGGISRQSVADNLFYPGTNMVNNDAETLLQHMDANGYDEVITNDGMTTFASKLDGGQEIDTDDPSNKPIVDEVETNGQAIDPTGRVYDKSDDGKLQVHQSVANEVSASQRAAEVEQVKKASQNLQKNTKMDEATKAEQISNLYSKPRNVEASQQVLNPSEGGIVDKAPSNNGGNDTSSIKPDVLTPVQPGSSSNGTFVPQQPPVAPDMDYIDPGLPPDDPDFR